MKEEFKTKWHYDVIEDAPQSYWLLDEEVEESERGIERAEYKKTNIACPLCGNPELLFYKKQKFVKVEYYYCANQHCDEYMIKNN